MYCYILILMKIEHKVVRILIHTSLNMIQFSSDLGDEHILIVGELFECKAEG